MNANPIERHRPIDAIVLDIEGTTTPIAFVYDVLFPFARVRLRAYLSDPANRSALVEPLRRLRAERAMDEAVAGMKDAGVAESRATAAEVKRDASGALQTPAVTHADAELERMAAYVERLMDEDRKSPGLKLLQGQIWRDGYRSGELQGEVFADVSPALRRWRDAGVTVAIYSSGSELAQRLLFGSTDEGDLTPLIQRFFDTSVGAKREPESYRRIADELGVPASRILFVSDVVAELDAARTAGCLVRLCIRPGNHPQTNLEYATIDSFDEIRLPGIGEAP